MLCGHGLQYIVASEPSSTGQACANKKIGPVAHSFNGILASVTFLQENWTLIPPQNMKFSLTESHLYLKLSSYHPPHTYRGIPKGLTTQFRRMCSSDEIFKVWNRCYKAHTVQSDRLLKTLFEWHRLEVQNSYFWSLFFWHWLKIQFVYIYLEFLKSVSAWRHVLKEFLSYSC